MYDSTSHKAGIMSSRVSDGEGEIGQRRLWRRRGRGAVAPPRGVPLYMRDTEAGTGRSHLTEGVAVLHITSTRFLPY